jgi:hypothetical protein
MSFLQGDVGGHALGPTFYGYRMSSRKRKKAEFKEKPGFSDTQNLDPKTGQVVKRKKAKRGTIDRVQDVFNPLSNWF